MADNLRVRLGRFSMPVMPGTDAFGNRRLYVAHPVKPGKLVYTDFSRAAQVAGEVIDQNPHVVAQVRPLKLATGRFATYAVSVARRVVA